MYMLIILAYLGIAALDTYIVYKHKEYGKLAVYYLLMILSAAIGTLEVLGFQIPSPADSIEVVINAVRGL